METSQGVKTVMIQQAEAGVRKLLERLQPLEEGDLKGLEQQVLETIFAVGREWMASILSEPTPEERAPGQRMGRCGHAQQLEGYRPKQVLTMVGKVTFRRAYYRCVVAEEQVQALWEQARQARTTSPTASESKQDQIDRLSIELDGVLARLRRGSVPMEEQERKRKGDVYREVKVGAVFEATRGPERSGLAPGV